MESSIHFTQDLLKDMFSKRLTNSVQEEFDQNKTLQIECLRNRLEATFQSVIEQHQKDLRSLFETEIAIIEKILTFYNSQLQCKQGETKQEKIWNVVLQKIIEELSTLTSNIKYFSSNAKIIEYLLQFIENAMNSQCITTNGEHLEKHILCSDIALIGLYFIINKAIAMEKSNYESNLQNSLHVINECKENLFKQCDAMKNAFELGQTLAEIIGKQIINEIDIVKSQFINHEAIQKQAYEESISQTNCENILKYVYDINRYFMELSLKEFEITLNTITHKHILNFQDLITLTIDKVNDIVQQCKHNDTATLRNDIRNEILDLSDLKLIEPLDTELFQMFSLNNIVRMPITDIDKFRQGFSNIRDNYKNIEERVTDLTENMKTKAFRSYWKTSDIYVEKKHRSDDSENNNDDSEFIFPTAKCYNEKYPAWYNDLNRQSMEGVGCTGSIPPPDQRLVWMVVRHVLVNHYRSSMIDYKKYDSELYPMNVVTLPADFEPKWKDTNFG
ncbi:unnamed protein product [Rotaria sordida]|uniref:Uncharacterized protein n=1 Tax=Rotaria sordida TaxID=392033 RepID=A0A814DW88_9BILA|nr:unnamed protein product [Rotaria sordida]CAF3689067.1 unnamed protein product [Rotaria sordida]